MAMKFGDRAWYMERMRIDNEERKNFNYKDELKVFLSLKISELVGTPLYEKIIKVYPEVNENITISELRTMKMLEKMFVESSQKAMDLTYKLDGSMSDLSVSVDFGDIDEATEGIK